MRSADEPCSTSAKVNRSGKAEWCKAAASNSTQNGLMSLTSAQMSSDGDGGYKERIVKLKVINTAIDGSLTASPPYWRRFSFPLSLIMPVRCWLCG